MDQPAAEAIDLQVATVRLPMALARLHLQLPVGSPVAIAAPVDPACGPDHLTDLLAGGGFDVDRIEVDGATAQVLATRARTLADTVGPGMRLLVCGLNPSILSADRGVGYARPGNRFWPAALDAGLIERDRDAVHALEASGVGMTDLVKRATVSAAELTRDEYRLGAARVKRLVAWLQPAAVCFVGLAGWRAAADATAVPGPQPEPFGGRPVYVMPSTSGLNAHASRAALAAHLADAIALAGTDSARPGTR